MLKKISIITISIIFCTTLSTKYERLLTSLLTSEFKNVAHIASLSVESTEELRSQLSNFIANTVDAGYMNTGYKNMPVIRTIKNHLMENGSRISYIKHAGYKNIFPAPEGVLITGIHCTLKSKNKDSQEPNNLKYVHTVKIPKYH